MKNLTEMYQLYSYCVVRITSYNSLGDLGTGTGFHIGNGYIVTARHVVEDRTIKEIDGYRYVDSEITCRNIYFPNDERVDLAVLETNFSLEYYMNQVHISKGGEDQKKVSYIDIGGHLDDWIDDEFILSKVLLIGYPPIPGSLYPVQVASEGEVNAIVDKYTGPHPHFIISSVSRGGFSGGPVISEHGFLLGVLTESLLEQGQQQELGYAAAISVEPLIDLILSNGLDTGENTTFLKKLISRREKRTQDAEYITDDKCADPSTVDYDSFL